MNHHQKTAIEYHCRFAFETVQRRFAFLDDKVSVVLTVNSGYE
jgi:hypothetical protein